jgi:hypothetical protein
MAFEATWIMEGSEMSDLELKFCGRLQTGSASQLAGSGETSDGCTPFQTVQVYECVGAGTASPAYRTVRQ